MLLTALGIGLIVPAGLSDRVTPLAIKTFSVVPLAAEAPKEVPRTAYHKAILYWQTHRWCIRNRRFLTIIDYSQPSFRRRMFVIDLRTGQVHSCLVAHGKNTGCARAVHFSNSVDSLESSRGFFLTGEEYQGKNGRSLRLLGLEKNVNDNALRRGIVLHGSRYVSVSAIVRNGGMLGRSWGCPAVPQAEVDGIIDRIKGGSLLYVYATQ